MRLAAALRRANPAANPVLKRLSVYGNPSFEITPVHLHEQRHPLLTVEMGDVADILGLGGSASTSGRASPLLGGPLGPLQENRRGKGAVVPLKKGKPQGVSREVYALLGSEGLPPEVRVGCPVLSWVAMSSRLSWNTDALYCRALSSVNRKVSEYHSKLV